MSRILLKPKPHFAMAKDLTTNFEALAADYWVLEGQFGNVDLFKSANFDIARFDEPILDAYVLAERIQQDGDGCIPKFEELTSVFEEGKRELNQLRVRLEGPSWFYYRHKVRYQVIGNQPNPDQIGYAPTPVNQGNFTRAAVRSHKTVDTDITPSSKLETRPIDNAAVASSLPAIRDGPKAKQDATKLGSLWSRNLQDSPFRDIIHSTASLTTTNNSFTRFVTPDAQDQQSARLLATLGDLNQKRREVISNFNKTLGRIEDENTDLENRIRILALAHTQLRVDNETITAEKNAIIAHKDLLIAQYKKHLAAHRTFVDDTTGELILGCIGKRSLAEDCEDARVRDLKKRKVDLHAEVDELREYKERLMADVKELESKNNS